MGLGYLCKCDNCRYTVQLLTGYGMLSWRRCNLIKQEILCGNYGKRAQKILRADDSVLVENEYAVYKCKKCARLQTEEHIVIHGRPRAYTVKRRCKKCNSVLSLVKISKISCPKCGSNFNVCGEQVIRWD